MAPSPAPSLAFPLCTDHHERMWAPSGGGEPLCLSCTLDYVRPLLGLSEQGEEAFRAWLFDGADRNDDDDALDRYGRAVQLRDTPEVMLAGFRRDRPEYFQRELGAYRRDPANQPAPEPISPPEEMALVLVQVQHKTRDLVLFLGASMQLASGIDRIGFSIALNRTRELLALAEAAQ